MSNIAFQGLAILALLIAGVTGFLVLTLKRRLDMFFQGSGADAELGKRLRENEEDFKSLRDDVARIDVMAEHAVQKLGVIRYNPFGDVGSDQSFALALLDHADNGAILSSLYSREGTRIYVKPIVKGESKHHLSNEEQEAIRRAIERE